MKILRIQFLRIIQVIPHDVTLLLTVHEELYRTIGTSTVHYWYSTSTVADAISIF